MNSARSVFVLDTSVWINLLATGRLSRIVELWGVNCILPEEVLLEIKRDPISSEKYSQEKHPLRNIRRIEVISLNAIEYDTFATLVSAPVVDRIGDGEAAAIAVAFHRKSGLGIDERKARRVLRERFDQIPLLTSVEILQLPSVLAGLGGEEASACFQRAVDLGRMHLPAGRLSAN